MKTLNKIALGSTLIAISGMASAAVPAAVTTAITESVADVGTIGAAVLGVVIVIATFGWLRRPMH